MIALLLAMLLSGPMKMPEAPVSKQCLLSCVRGVEFGTEVLICLYDELPTCARLQPECRDEGPVICRPRVVNLGEWSPIPRDYVPDSNPWQPPPPSSLPPMGP